MSYQVVMNQGLPTMSFQSGGSDLLTNVILSLEIAQGSFFAAPDFGMRRRPRLKRTERNAQLVKGDAEQALQWLINSGRATAIVVVTSLDDRVRNRLRINVQATGAKGNQVSYEKFVEVV